uniref:U-box domain-containing protein n=1 Tax=Oryza glumipatula TaxID=40148 RepID=A0A0D9ZKM9_9ORYZ
MGRKESSTTTTTTAAAAAATRSMRLPPQHQALEVKIPSFFRCPISLDVMRSPVSLCTGVTYDRASIQRWLDSGNTTCPATMLPLPSTDLVPNLTLRSLISHWSSSSSPATSGDASVTSSPAGLVRQVASPDADPSAALRQLAAYLSDDDVDEFEKNALVGAGGAAEAVASVLRRKGEREVGVEGCEAAVRVLAAVVAMDGVEDANKRRVAAGLAADAAASAASLARVMRGASGLEARVDAARLVEALRVLESAVGCAEGRAALCEDAEEAVPAVVGRMMKSGRDGAEAAVAVLWAVCHKYRDRRAADAAAASEGGLTRLLLLLQSGCSPAARQMALELLKIYKVNAKSCLAGYDSKTTHIMPF